MDIPKTELIKALEELAELGLGDATVNQLIETYYLLIEDGILPQ